MIRRLFNRMLNIKAMLFVSLCLSSPLHAQANPELQNEQIRKTYRKLQEESNKNLERLLERIERIGVEFLVAGPLPDTIISKFGHALVRFVDTESDSPLSDLVVGIVAQTGPVVEMVDGLTGTYDLAALATSLAETVRHYQRSEGRGLTRILIPSTPNQRRELIQNLIEVNRNPSRYGKYRFHENNCVTVLLRVMREASFPLFRESPVVPVWGPMYLRNMVVSPFPPIVLPSEEGVIQALKNNVSIRLPREVLRWPSLPAAEINRIPTSVLYLASMSRIPFPSDFAQTFRSALKQRAVKEGVDIAEIYRVRPLPHEVYRAGPETCASSNILASKVRNTWPLSRSMDWARRVQTSLNELRLDVARSSQSRFRDVLNNETVITVDCLTRELQGR